MLLQVGSRLVTPLQEDDYFAKEHLSTWGLDGFWGLPAYPATPYYRTYSAVVDPKAHLYEFVVPMVPPTWNDPDRVTEYAARLAASGPPTAVDPKAVKAALQAARQTTRGPLTDRR